MNFLLLAWKYRRWIGYVVAAIAVSLLAWRIMAWRHGYQQLGEARTALAAEQKQHAADLDSIRQDMAASESRRKALAADMDAIRAKYAALPVPPPKTLIRTVEVPRGPSETCPSPRVSPEFVSVFNAAGTP